MKPPSQTIDKPATGHGFLDIEWTDADRRVVERRRIPLTLAGGSEVAFSLDIRRAVTMKNSIVAHLSFDEIGPGGAIVHRENDAAASFVASPPGRGWSDYQIIMWQLQTPAAYAALKRLGVSAGMLPMDHERHVYIDDWIAPLLDNDLRFYLENIATDSSKRKALRIRSRSRRE